MSLIPSLKVWRRGAPSPAEVLNAMAVPVLLVDREGTPVNCNPAAEMMFGRSEGALAERGWEGILPPDSPLHSLMAEAAETQAELGAYDLEIAFVDGTIRQADVMIGPFAENEDYLVVAFQRRSVAGLVERQSDNRGAARSATALAAMLAHEIKNPLAGIRGAAQLLGGDTDEEGRGELSGLIISEVERIRALIDRMERFTDPRPARLEPTNIHAILSHVRRIAAAEGIEIEEQYDPSLPDVPADRDGLVQLFLNLVRNAREAAGEEGRILITTAYRHGLKMGARGGKGRVAVPIEVCVIDDGPGAAPEVAGHMFDAFVSSKRGVGGLGLALVAKIAADHQGHIEYARDDRAGRTVMRLLLPRAKS